jgi:hypothetical protein
MSTADQEATDSAKERIEAAVKAERDSWRARVDALADAAEVAIASVRGGDAFASADLDELERAVARARKPS